MALIRKIRTIFRVLWTGGLPGICQVMGQKLIRLGYFTAPTAPPDLFHLGLLFRYATSDDLIKLKAKYPESCFREPSSRSSRAWGLKQMGTLFCVEKINEISPAKMLQVGAGCNTFFDETFGSKHEYWMIDDVGFYPKDKFDAALQKRRNTRFVQALLGTYSPELPESYFDLVFSVSVLEHVPPKQRTDVYRDMFRVLRPGGFIVHSIDVAGEVRGYEEYALIKNAGFLVSPYPDLTIRVRFGEGEATLFEPIDIVFRSYFGKGRQDMWTNLRSIQGYTPTILVVAQKPLPNN